VGSAGSVRHTDRISVEGARSPETVVVKIIMMGHSGMRRRSKSLGASEKKFDG
jgi:hypothetical protein